MANFEKRTRHSKKEKMYLDYLREAAAVDREYRHFLDSRGNLKKIKYLYKKDKDDYEHRESWDWDEDESDFELDK